MYDGEFLIDSWSKANKKKYESKGYIFTDYGDKIKVLIEDALTNAQITIVCDYCGEEMTQAVRTYRDNKKRAVLKTDACKKCWSKKLKETMQIKYGVDNTSNLIETVEKRTQTFIDRYGVTNPLLLEEVKEKTRQTNLLKYGYEHPMKVPGEANRRIELACKTMYEKGNGACSFQQQYIHNIIGGELNYPVKTLKLDIAFPEKHIYVEYDGSGHDLQVVMGQKTREEHEIIQRRRYYALKSSGWKMIKIISTKDKLPNPHVLKYYIDVGIARFKYYGHNYYELNFDDMTTTYAGETLPLHIKKIKSKHKPKTLE